MIDGRAEIPTDAELAGRAAGGDVRAFEDLYRRHADVAWRVAQAVTRNPDDANDAVSEAFTRVLQALAGGRLADASRFRAYLLTATRNAAIDAVRRSGRARPTGEVLDLTDPGRVPGERVDDQTDAAFVGAAFRSLPERWRSVLWLTEVEGIPPREVGELLGIAPNTASQLAVRARAGLRERYLQAHLAEATARECRFTVEHLGAYVAGRLSARHTAKVDQHLAACGACQERHDELEDLGSTLRRVALPLPLGLAPLALGNWKLLSASRFSVHSLQPGSSLALKVQKPLAAMSVGLVGVGIIGASIIGQGDAIIRGRRQRPPVAQPGAPTAPPVNQFTPAGVVSLDDTLDRFFIERAFAGGSGLGGDAAAPTPPPPPTGDTAAAAPPPPSGGTTPPPPPRQPLAQVTTSATYGSNSAVTAAGTGENSCTGARVGSTTAGSPCPAPDGSGNNVTLATGGTALGSATVRIPLP